MISNAAFGRGEFDAVVRANGRFKVWTFSLSSQVNTSLGQVGGWSLGLALGGQLNADVR